ncbi:SRPBCC domain-containing protein [Streptomyces sp. NPDC047085]|uniref:SRPBCC domain-containing protein n=1 Tax=Streptomyces sp. NPDC047085 TaxID=3155140 RepID=UPI0033BFF601
MRRISCDIHIQARPEQVWAVLTDFDRFHEWNPFLVEATGRPQPGTRLSLRFRLPDSGTEMVFKPTVLTSEPHRVLRWRGRFGVKGIFDGLHSFELTPVDGGTHLVQMETFTGVLVPFTRSVITQSDVGFQRLNEALKERVETLAAA